MHCWGQIEILIQGAFKRPTKAKKSVFSKISWNDFENQSGLETIKVSMRKSPSIQNETKGMEND